MSVLSQQNQVLVQQNHDLQIQAAESIRNEEAHKQNNFYLQAQVNILKQKMAHKKAKHQDTLDQL